MKRKLRLTAWSVERNKWHLPRDFRYKPVRCKCFKRSLSDCRIFINKEVFYLVTFVTRFAIRLQFNIRNVTLIEYYVCAACALTTLRSTMAVIQFVLFYIGTSFLCIGSIVFSYHTREHNRGQSKRQNTAQAGEN